ncbi:hypothetical protein KKG71_01395 [Patescibacteria group bacterium]|nr:hypothetical protein [Patescibacteria group bacterium]
MQEKRNTENSDYWKEMKKLCNLWYFSELVLWDTNTPNSEFLEKCGDNQLIKSYCVDTGDAIRRIISEACGIEELKQIPAYIRDIEEMNRLFGEQNPSKMEDNLETAINDSPFVVSDHRILGKKEALAKRDEILKMRESRLEERIKNLAGLLETVQKERLTSDFRKQTDNEKIYIKAVQKSLEDEGQEIDLEADYNYQERMELFRRASVAVNEYIEKEISVKFLDKEFALQREEVTHTHDFGGLFKIMGDTRYHDVVRYEAKRKFVLMRLVFIPAMLARENDGNSMQKFFEDLWMKYLQPENIKMGEMNGGNLFFYNLGKNNECEGKAQTVAIRDKIEPKNLEKYRNNYSHMIRFNTRDIVLNKGTDAEEIIPVEISTRSKSLNSRASKEIRQGEPAEVNRDDENGIRFVFMQPEHLEKFRQYIHAQFGINDERDSDPDYVGIEGYSKYSLNYEGHNYEIQCFTTHGLVDYTCKKEVSWQEYELRRTYLGSSILPMLYNRKKYPELDYDKLYKKLKKTIQNGNRTRNTIESSTSILPERDNNTGDLFNIDDIDQFLHLLLWRADKSNRDVNKEYDNNKKISEHIDLEREAIRTILKKLPFTVTRLRDLCEVIKDSKKKKTIVDVINDSPYFLNDPNINARRGILEKRKARIEFNLKLLEDRENWLKNIQEKLKGNNISSYNETLCKEFKLMKRERLEFTKEIRIIKDSFEKLTEERLSIFRRSSFAVNQFLLSISEDYLGSIGSLQTSEIEHLHTPGDLFAVICDERYADSVRKAARRKMVLMTLLFIDIDKRLTENLEDMEFFFRDVWNKVLVDKESKIGTSSYDHTFFYNLNPESGQCSESELVAHIDRPSPNPNEIQTEDGKPFKYQYNFYTRGIMINDLKDEKHPMHVQVTPRIRNEMEIAEAMFRNNDRNFEKASLGGTGLRIVCMSEDDIIVLRQFLRKKFGFDSVKVKNVDKNKIMGFHLWTLKIKGRTFTVRVFTPEGIVNFNKMVGVGKKEHDMKKIFKLSPILRLLFPPEDYPDLDLNKIFEDNIKRIREENLVRDLVNGNGKDTNTEIGD